VCVCDRGSRALCLAAPKRKAREARAQEQHAPFELHQAIRRNLAKALNAAVDRGEVQLPPPPPPQPQPQSPRAQVRPPQPQKRKAAEPAEEPAAAVQQPSPRKPRQLSREDMFRSARADETGADLSCEVYHREVFSGAVCLNSIDVCRPLWRCNACDHAFCRTPYVHEERPLCHRCFVEVIRSRDLKNPGEVNKYVHAVVTHARIMADCGYVNMREEWDETRRIIGRRNTDARIQQWDCVQLPMLSQPKRKIGFRLPMPKSAAAAPKARRAAQPKRRRGRPVVRFSTSVTVSHGVIDLTNDSD
jgi:hypothetical protein